MNKVYLLVPVLALTVFGGYHWQRNGVLRQQAAVKAEQDRVVQAAQLKAEADAQQQLLAAVVAAQEKRKQERLAQEAQARADQADRQAALDARDQERAEEVRLTRQAGRLQKDIEDETAALAKLQSDQQAAREEQAFLLEFTAQAQANVQALSATLEKIAAAESARAAVQKKSVSAPTP